MPAAFNAAYGLNPSSRFVNYLFTTHGAHPILCGPFTSEHMSKRVCAEISADANQIRRPMLIWKIVNRTLSANKMQIKFRSIKMRPRLCGRQSLFHTCGVCTSRAHALGFRLRNRARRTHCMHFSNYFSREWHNLLFNRHLIKTEQEKNTVSAEQLYRARLLI